MEGQFSYIFMGTQALGMMNNAFVLLLAPVEAQRLSALLVDLIFLALRNTNTCVLPESGQPLIEWEWQK